MNVLPDEDLLAGLRRRVHDGVRDALRGADTVALVNFPNHGNPGDPAIWWGTRCALRELGVRVGYQCAWDTYSPDALRRAVPDGPVLINGGGNFGDLYAGQQGLRERLLAELRGRRIVQLPQSVHFGQTENLDRVRRLIASHGDVALLVREQRSEKIARDAFDAEVALVPDMAFALPRLDRPTTPHLDLVWLHRREGDPEYVSHGGPPDGVRTLDVEWLHLLDPEPPWLLSHRLARRANTLLRVRARWAWRPFGATFVPLSKGWVRRGLHVLSSGRVVVTDKLHGHLLALLAGIPHVVLDNGYGKVRATYETWTSPSTLAHWADHGDQARALALRLLEE
ncbi:pyruvyl transferase EpsO [Herbihabitans rhizosphaerae]|uniref:Pyruvyl transferase EpsO n=1 Tax=Herbihabitans rhizosphaerae TaxID=1872711 RepID=A0A4Q7L4Q5_9PSEU|nr:polysaccharide pyruvyl transferase family protein [Herbihabitans rhizosphaerae]RZS44214.1 pyruvyl transferase EpsO [Herbihabitans rhizosphaerae]